MGRPISFKPLPPVTQGQEPRGGGSSRLHMHHGKMFVAVVGFHWVENFPSSRLRG